MPWNIKNWRRRHILKSEPIPDDSWQRVVDRLGFLRGLSPDELLRLRECVALFLHVKQISGAHGLVVTYEMRLLIAAQACILILNLDLDYYAGWVEIIVYPGEFIRRYEYVDDDGVVHDLAEPASGESWLGGPVILSWEDTAAAESATGYNVVIHEFAHKLDMLNGEANGFPPLHPGMSQHAWSDAFGAAYAEFRQEVWDAEADEAIASDFHIPHDIESGEDSYLDPYAAEDPAEFFAVVSEAFFERPLMVKQYFPAVYEQLALFYRQDPVQRWSES
ncbi:MAG TPA: M90 family metallopeptidase [Nitrosospira sp.]|nr:M90 family metallopeptidase [Nitrosospira sp.]